MGYRCEAVGDTITFLHLVVLELGDLTVTSFEKPSELAFSFNNRAKEKTNDL